MCAMSINPQISKTSKLRSTVPFKLKDKEGRDWKAFDLKAQFGFLPETILVSKLHGKNNIIVLSAVLPKT